MRVRPPKAWCTLCLTLATGSILATGACKQGSGTVGSSSGTTSSSGGSLPECPKSGDYTAEFTRHKDYRFAGPGTGLLSVAGRRTHIPEFHDCQKLIGDSSGVLVYLTRAAVFSADDLQQKAARINQIRDSVIRMKVEARVANGGSIFVVAEIYSPDGDYPPLGIKRDFNCLFLYPVNKPPSYLEANVVPVGTNEAQCTSIPHTSPGKILEVHRTDFGDIKHVPDVARWDWDAAHRTQYIGVGCYSAWCDIGPAAFTSSNPHANPPVPPSSAQMAVKGWYDEQTLGFPTATGIGLGTVKGTFVPMPDLGEQDGSPGKNFEKFKPVATVALDGGSTVYFTKLNLAPSPITAMTDTVYLCHGTWSKCALADAAFQPKCGAGTDPNWWIKIVSPKPAGGTPPLRTAYFCVTRRQHPGMKIPGVVRWRWAIKDETMWVSCVEGCCELEAESESIVP